MVRFMRAHPKLKDVPLIVLSTREEAITKAEAFALGANDYLVKLPDRIELVARIRYHSKGYINLLERNDAYAALLKKQQELASELARAAEYVVSLLPQEISQTPIRTQWRFFPSAQLGGDCFGYHWIDNDHFAMYLLDVCGHGVGSALLSVSALNALKSQTLPNTDFRSPSRVLAALNSAFQMQDHNNLFFTVWYGVFNRVTRELSYASGGHPPATLVNGLGAVTRLATQNFIIGGFSGASYSGGAVKVELPSRLYLFSDGVYEVERRDGSMWSLDELNEYLASPEVEIGREIDHLYGFLQEMRGAEILDDDFSMLRLEFTE
jgi:sigma-B regulation protein RsbU (phosphoserine phosphatase)